jgi:hypothetical protein
MSHVIDEASKRCGQLEDRNDAGRHREGIHRATCRGRLQ